MNFVMVNISEPAKFKPDRKRQPPLISFSQYFLPPIDGQKHNDFSAQQSSGWHQSSLINTHAALRET
jgi:hypothetical protein